MYTTSTENTCKIAFGSLFHQKMEMLSGNISALLVSVSCFFASFTQSAIIPHEVIGVIPACVAWPYQQHTFKILGVFYQLTQQE